MTDYNQAIDVSEPKRETVAVSLDLMDASIAALSDELSTLIDKISPILRLETTEQAPDMSKDIKSVSDHSIVNDRLMSMTTDIDRQIKIVREIRYRVDL